MAAAEAERTARAAAEEQLRAETAARAQAEEQARQADERTRALAARLEELERRFREP